MLYREFVKQKMATPEVKALAPKERMRAIGKMWRAQKGGDGVAVQKGGSKKHHGVAHQTGGARKKRRMATVAPPNGIEEEGEGIAMQAGGSIADLLSVSNEIAPSMSLDGMSGGSAWSSFKYGFALPFRATAAVAPIAAKILL